MASLPPLAANAVRDALTNAIRKPDGTTYQAFSDQRDALVAMREMEMDHEDRLRKVEAAVSALPFPYRVSSTPLGA